MRTLLLLAFLPACGGLTSTTDKLDDSGGGDLDSVPLDTGSPLDSAVDGNSAPIADAGADQSATVGMIVAFDGSGSSDPDGDALDYAWEITTAPSASSAELINAAFADPQFIPDAEGRYVISLVVNDGALDSTPDLVEVTATQDDGRPVANAGADQSVSIGAAVLLDGTASSDPDGDPLAFTWTMASRPGGSTAALSSANTANPSFTADVAGTYQLSLTVSDGTEYSDPDVLVVTATDPNGGGSSSSCGCHAGPSPAGTSTMLLALVAGLATRRRRATGPG